MIALLWVRWWYGAGWADCVQRAGAYLQRLESSFSIGMLVRTLFAPWKQVITVSSGSFDERVKAVLDNLISRCVGFVVRCIVLLSAAVVMTLGALAALAAVIAWPVLPVAALALLIGGLL